MPTDAVLLCRAGDVALALPLDRVMGVAPLGPVTPLPFCPASVEGLVLAMGLAVVQVSVAEALGLPAPPGGVLAIVRRGDDVRALRMEAIVAMAELEAAEAAADAGPSWSAGAVSWRGEPVPVLDLDRVWAAADLPGFGAVGTGRAAPLALARPGGDGSGGADGAADGAASGQDAHLLLDIGGEHYSVPTEGVVELLPVGPARPVPGAPHWVAGLVDWRGAPILALDARTLLGHGAPGEGRLALLVDHGEAGTVGLLIDAALGISYIDRADAHEVREATAGVTRYVVAEGGRIIGVIDPAALLAQVAERLAGLVPRAPRARPEPAAASGASHAAAALVLRVGSNLFAVPLDRVERILPAVMLSRLPFDGNGFDGVIDIGELPIPVLDLRGEAERAADARPPCTLVRLEGATAGIVVDQVLQIESPAPDAIDPVAADDGLPISGVFDVRGRAVAMLMLDRLLPILA